MDFVFCAREPNSYIFLTADVVLVPMGMLPVIPRQERHARMIRGFGSPWVQELSSYMLEKASAARASGRCHDLPEWISS